MPAAEWLGQDRDPAVLSPSLHPPPPCEFHSCPAWHVVRGALEVRFQEGKSAAGVLLAPVKTNLLADKNKGARITASICPRPVALILLQGAGSHVPDWHGPSGFKGGNSSAGRGFGRVPWCPPGGAAGDASPRVSLASHTLRLIFLGAESGLFLSREVGRECPGDGRGKHWGVFWARAGWQDLSSRCQAPREGRVARSARGPQCPWAVAGPQPLPPSALGLPPSPSSLLRASFMSLDVGLPLPLRAPLPLPGWCLSPAHLGGRRPTAFSYTHLIGQVREQLPQESLGHGG